MKFAPVVVVIFASSAALAAPMPLASSSSSTGSTYFSRDVAPISTSSITDNGTLTAEGLLGTFTGLPIVGPVLGIVDGLLGTVKSLLPPSLLNLLNGLPIVGGLLSSLAINAEVKPHSSDMDQQDKLAAAQYVLSVAASRLNALAASASASAASSSSMPATAAAADVDSTSTMDSTTSTATATAAAVDYDSSSTTMDAPQPTADAQDVGTSSPTATATETRSASVEAVTNVEFTLSGHIGNGGAPESEHGM